jgi:hypothetical protein
MWDCRGDEVVVGAGAQEARRVPALHVGFGQVAQLGHRVHLCQRFGQVELGKTMLGRNVGEQVVDGFHPDRAQHRLAFRIGMRDVAHSHSPWGAA